MRRHLFLTARLTPLILFLTLFCLYLRTLSPSITLMDGVEYTVASHLLGIPHPPGYPLFSILAKLFQLLPLASIPFRTNLFAALTAALMIVVMFSTLVRRWGSSFGALMGILPLALSQSFWENAVTTEVYGLHMAMLSLTIAFLLLRPASLGALLAALFVLGIGVSNHQVILLFFPAVGLYILFSKELRRYFFAHLGTATALFILGSSIYLMLVLRSAQNPRIDRGHPGSLSGLQEFMGARFNMATTNIQSNPADSTRMQFKRYIASNLTDSPGLFLIFLPLGIYFLIRNDTKLLLLTGIGWFVQVFVITTTFYSSSEQILYMVDPFYLPAHLFVNIWVGAGVIFLSRHKPRFARLLVAVCMVYMIFPLVKHFAPNDYSENFIALDWAHNVLHSAEPDAVMIVAVDEYFPLAYAQLVERYRRDVTPVHVVALAEEPEQWWTRIAAPDDPRVYFPVKADTPESIKDYRGRAGAAVASYIKSSWQRPLNLAHFDSSLTSGLSVMLRGIVYEVRNGPEQTPDPTVSLKLWQRYRLRRVNKLLPGIGESEKRVIDNYSVSLNNLAGVFLYLNRTDAALRTFRKTLEIDARNPVAQKYIEKLK